jgi:hypothetical protein
MKMMTSQCLAAAGIIQIVWIDDFFASPSRDELASAVHKQVEKLREQGRPNVDLPAFTGIDLTMGKSEVEDACVEILEGLSEAQLVDAVRGLATLSGVVVAEDPSQPDLSPDDFRQLREAFGAGLHTFSLGTWTSTGIKELGSAGRDTLFLIDKEFSREGAGMDGIDVLEQLVRQTSAFCIILTHTCTEVEQEQRRVEFAAAKGLMPHRFCVLSKQQSTDVPIDARFARAIRSVMTHRFSGEIAHAISEIIQKSAQETVAELTNQSVSDLERALFENPTEEGVLEYDVLLRVFDIQRRHALSQALRGDAIQNLIRASRNFRLKTASFGLTKPAAEMSFFREWREREVFEDGAGINGLNAPLACGDVFECEGAKRSILIAQPCDMMIRENGSRRAQAGLLVGANELPSEEAQPPAAGSRFFDLRGVFRGGKQWRIDFQNTVAVELSVLDWAVFNSDGSVQLRRDHPEPSIALPVGWARRLKRVKTEVFPEAAEPRVPSFAIGRHAAALRAVIEGDFVRFPLRRIGRVEPATATAILAAWATFQTRAALDYDFAHADSGAACAPTEQARAGTTEGPKAGA